MSSTSSKSTPALLGEASSVRLSFNHLPKSFVPTGLGVGPCCFGDTAVKCCSAVQLKCREPCQAFRLIGDSAYILLVWIPMGNTSASPKGGRLANAPQAAKGLDDLLPALRERFEELAGPPAVATTPPHPSVELAPTGESIATQDASTERLPPQEHTATTFRRGGEQEKRFVLFDDWSELPGPRGAHLARRLYGVLDADGDGRLDFEEFASAACLLKGSPDEHKLTLLFKMYGDSNRGGLVGREGLKAFILDVIAVSPPLHEPPHLVVAGAAAAACGGGGGSREAFCSSASTTPRDERHPVTRDGKNVVATNANVQQPDLERELGGVLSRMAGVVLTEFDGDNDGWLTEKEWRAYLKREEESLGAFLKTLSDSVGKFLLP